MVIGMPGPARWCAGRVGWSWVSSSLCVWNGLGPGTGRGEGTWPGMEASFLDVVIRAQDQMVPGLHRLGVEEYWQWQSKNRHSRTLMTLASRLDRVAFLPTDASRLGFPVPNRQAIRHSYHHPSIPCLPCLSLNSLRHQLPSFPPTPPLSPGPSRTSPRDQPQHAASKVLPATRGLLPET